MKSTVKFTIITVKFFKIGQIYTLVLAGIVDSRLHFQSWRLLCVYWTQGGTNVAVNRSHQTPAKPASRSSKSTHHSALRRSARPRGFLGPTWEIHNCRDLKSPLRRTAYHYYTLAFSNRVRSNLNSFGLKTTCGFGLGLLGISQCTKYFTVIFELSPSQKTLYF